MPQARSPMPQRRMLAVTQFFEDDDMAFVLDRMLSRHNPNELAPSLRPLLRPLRRRRRPDPAPQHLQRPQSMGRLSAAEKATGIGSHFATSLELTPATEYIPAADDAQGTLFDNVGTDTACPPSTRHCHNPIPQQTLQPAARFRSRHQHSLSIPTPLRLLAEGRALSSACGRAAL